MNARPSPNPQTSDSADVSSAPDAVVPPGTQETVTPLPLVEPLGARLARTLIDWIRKYRRGMLIDFLIVLVAYTVIGALV